jgi:hypothetical protein
MAGEPTSATDWYASTAAGIHRHVIHLHIRVVRGDAPRHGAPQAGRLARHGQVHHGDVMAAGAGHPASRIRDDGDGLLCASAGHVAAQAAHKEQVNAFQDFVAQGSDPAHGWMRAHRAKAHHHPQRALDGDQSALGLGVEHGLVFRLANVQRAEQDRVGLAACFERGLRQRVARGFLRCSPDEVFLKVERVTKTLGDLLQNVDGFRSYFWPDPIAGQNCNLGLHISLPGVCDLPPGRRDRSTRGQSGKRDS